jgi:glycosyltransferase involved in cell wall biosynthesis
MKKIVYLSLMKIPNAVNADSYLNLIRHSIGHYNFFPDHVKVISLHLSQFNTFLQEGNVEYHFCNELGLLMNVMAGINPDILIVHDIANLRYFKFLNQKLGIKKIVYWYHGGKPGLAQRLFFRMYYRRVSAFIFHNKEDVTFFPYRKASLPTILKLPEGSSSFKCEMPKPDDKKLIWVGRNIPSKFPEESLAAMRKILLNIPEISVYYILKVESDQMNHRLLTHLKSLKSEFENRFLYYLNASSQLVNECMNKSHVFLTLSDKESTGFALLEAMSCACIPVVKNIPAHIQVLPESEFGVINSNNEDEILVVVKQCLQWSSINTHKNILRHFQNNWSHQSIAGIIYNTLLK